MNLSTVFKKALDFEFLTVEEGMFLFNNAALTELMLVADEFNVTSYPYVGGLIGNDILRRFNLIMNYQKREIHLLPNSHFRDLFDYSYTGMSIYFIEGKIMIDDIIKGSPAFKAGFMIGDVILAINNNFSNDINQYKNMLQSNDERIKALIMRDEKPLIITFRPGKMVWRYPCRRKI